MLDNYKITIIICFFGKLPSIFPFWMDSCVRNSQFDFLIFIDQDISVQAPNITVKKTQLKQIRDLARTKLQQDDLCLQYAYKLCDYKPMYGVIFEDYLRESDFWGMCDMDMIFGDLSHFITPDILASYDKIYQLGHLTLYRNVYEVNHSFELDGFVDWQTVIHTDKHCKLCERGMMQKHRGSNLRVYIMRDYADISKIHRRYQLSRWLVPHFDKDRYKHQLFYYENGRVLRAVSKSGVVFTQEFAYIHLQKRKLKAPRSPLGKTFYVTANTFIPKEPGTPTAEAVSRLNPYRGQLFELYECAEFEVKKWIRKFTVKRIGAK